MENKRGNGLTIFVLLLVGCGALYLFARSMQTPTALAGPNTQAIPIAALATRTITPTVPSPAEKTLAAGEVALQNLAIQNTQIAQQIVIDSATLEAQIKIEQFRHDLLVADALGTQQAIITATAQVLTSTPLAATQIALRESVQSLQENAELERQLMPYTLFWEQLGQPMAVFGLVVGIILTVFVSLWRRVLRKMDQQEEDQDEEGQHEPKEAAPVESQVMQFEKKSNDGRTLHPYKLNITLKALEEIAEVAQEIALENEKRKQNSQKMLSPLADSLWLGNGSGYTKGSWYSVKTELIAAGFAEWVNADAPAQGVIFTEDGEAMIEEVYRRSAQQRDLPPLP